MKKWIMLVGAAMVMFLTGCINDDLDALIMIDSTFEATTENWQGGFAEYSSATDSASLERLFGRSRLPAVLDSTKYGLKVQGHNRSEAMFMFIKKKVSGLTPNGNYDITFDIHLGTPFTDQGTGAGGATYLKAGASPNEPKSTLTNKFYTFNLDKGKQSEGGKDLVAVGNIGNGMATDGYRLVQRSNSGSPLAINANANGEIWLCIGTDSGFKGLTTLYYDHIKTTISERNAN